MSFYGDSFVFDGVPCERYGLMLYNVGSSKQGQTSFTSSEFSEDRIARRYDPLYYGEIYNAPLSFNIVFGLNPALVDAGKCIDRYDFECISSWLVNRDGYKCLKIAGGETEYYRYFCRISDLQVVDAGVFPQVMSCKVTCDSPFGYLDEKTIVYDSDDEEDVVLHSRSTYNGTYYPVVQIEVRGQEISIQNDTIGGDALEFSLPAAFATGTITVDNLNQIITYSGGDNLYPYCNKKFIGLARGDNAIHISGDCEVTFICSYPVNVGG